MIMASYLPPAYEVRGKVMFSVCLSVHKGGTLTSGPRSFPEVPQPLVQVLFKGVTPASNPKSFPGGTSSPVTGPCPRSCSRSWGGGGYPIQDKIGVPSRQNGYLLVGQGGTPPDRIASDAMLQAVPLLQSRRRTFT